MCVCVCMYTHTHTHIGFPHFFYPICVKFGMRDPHLKLCSICEFLVNRNRDSHAFIMGVNVIYIHTCPVKPCGI